MSQPEAVKELAAEEIARFVVLRKERATQSARPRLGIDIQCALDSTALRLNFLLQKSNGINQLLGTRRTAGHIYINRNDLIDALHQRVIVEYATRGGARAHRDHPLGFGHLLPKLADHG